VAHCAIETLSVLTRLPGAQRSRPGDVVAFLDDQFPEPPLLLSPVEHGALPGRLADLGVVGGAVYDGLIAMTAAAHAEPLVSLDVRATETYRRCGVEHRLLA